MTQTVVVLGASWAGLQVAHRLLKKKDLDIKVVLVSKLTHLYFNLASVRAAVIPGLIQENQIFGDIEAGLKRYPAERWEFVIGTAERADFAAKTVSVAVTAGPAEPRTIAYDQLVLATGARSPSDDVPWKGLDTYEETVSKLRDTQARCQAASHIVVAGAGLTGVEVAGELGCEWGKTKEVVLLSAGNAVLGGDQLAAPAAAELQKLNVKIRYDVHVDGAAALPDGRTEVRLEGGETIVTDVYLATMGLVPNSEYVDAQYLTERKTVMVDDYLRVQGLADVWAAGDVVSKPRASAMISEKQAAGVAKNVEAALRGKPPSVVKGMPFDFVSCSIGRKSGLGRAGPVRLPSTAIWFGKCRTLLTERMPGMVDGSSY